LAWFGEQMQQGLDKKIAELNAAGGVLGQQQGIAVAVPVTKTHRGGELSANPYSVVIAEDSHDAEPGRCSTEKLIV
jgi:hypothetical protein